jgi:hypothetical protein
MADHHVLHAVATISHVLDDYYPVRRNLKLHRRYAEVVEAVLRIKPVDYAQRGKSLHRALDRAKRELTRELYEAFLQYGPSPTDYPREAIYWAIATIMTAFGLEAGEIIHIADRIKKRCLKHTQSAE